MSRLEYVELANGGRETKSVLLDRIIYTYAKTRLGEKGYQVYGDEFDQLHYVVRYTFACNHDQGIPNDSEMWPLPIMYIVNDQLKLLGLNPIDMKISTMTASDKKKIRGVNRIIESDEQGNWTEEKRPEVRAKLQAYCHQYEDEEPKYYQTEEYKKLTPEYKLKVKEAKKKQRQELKERAKSGSAQKKARSTRGGGGSSSKKRKAR